MAQFREVWPRAIPSVKPESTLSQLVPAKNMPDSLSPRTRLHLTRWLIVRSGGKPEQALLLGPVQWQVAAEQQATAQPLGLGTIGNPLNNFRAEE